MALVHVFAQREPDGESHPTTNVASELRELVEQYESIVQTASSIHTSSANEEEVERFPNVDRTNI